MLPSSDRVQFIAPGSKADLLAMCQGLFPADIRIAVQEIVMMMMPSLFTQIIGQLAVRHRVSFKTCVRTGLIQRYGIEGGKHTDIRQNRCVVL